MPLSLAGACERRLKKLEATRCRTRPPTAQFPAGDKNHLCGPLAHCWQGPPSYSAVSASSRRCGRVPQVCHLFEQIGFPANGDHHNCSSFFATLARLFTGSVRVAKTPSTSSTTSGYILFKIQCTCEAANSRLPLVLSAWEISTTSDEVRAAQVH